MARRLALAATVTAMVAALAVPAAATAPTITFQCCSYSSPVVRIAPGGSVAIEPAAGLTFADHPLVFVDGVGSKSTADATPVTRTFAAAGIYRFYCAIHGFAIAGGGVGGMSGQIVVTTNVAPTAAFTVTPATATAG